MGAWIDITGQTFHSWKAIEYVGKELWKCQCLKCGNFYLRHSHYLRFGKTKQCLNCLMASGNSHFKHGHATHPKASRTFSVWSSMIQRCENPAHKAYPRYGGRGIFVCERWHEFLNFLEDMGESPLGLSIDRLNNDDGYYKGNCAWKTRKEQSRNRGDNRWVIIGSERMTLTEAAERLSYHPNGLCKVLKRAGVTKQVVPRLATTEQLKKGGGRRVVVLS